MSQVFISHIEEEQNVAEEIARGLEEAGYTVWYYERDSYPGTDYLQQVDRAIEECNAVLVLISPQSVDSRQIGDEVKWARELQKNFVPVLQRMSWTEFQQRRTQWRMALGITAGVVITQAGVSAIIPRITNGLRNLGIPPAAAVTSRSKGESVPKPGLRDRAKTNSQSPRRRSGRTAIHPGVLDPTLSKAALREIRTFGGHFSAVAGVAVSGDGRLVVSASTDHTLKVWEAASGRELHTLRGHSDAVWGVAVSGNGQLAVSASGDKTLKVWELETGCELRTLPGHTNYVNAVAVTADGKRAVSASSDRTLKVWDLASGRELRILKGHTGEVHGVALTGDGRLVVSAAHDDTIRVWELRSGRELCALTGHTNCVNGVAVSESGLLAVSASADNTLKVWDLESGHESRTLQGHASYVNGAAVSGDGKLAASAAHDQTVRVWELISGCEVARFRAGASLSSCVFLPGGRTIFAADAGGVVHVLRLDDK